jgi:predicted metalloendopeptidase
MRSRNRSTTLRALFVGLGVGFAPVGHGGPPAPEPLFPPGLDTAGMDTSVAPGDDFFAYANGTWLKTTDIPPDRSDYGIGQILEDLTERRLVDLLQQLSGGTQAPGPDARKISDYYSSFMDEAGIEALGLQPLQPLLKEIAAISDRHALARFLGRTLRTDVDVLNSTQLYTDNVLGLWVAQDLDRPDRYVPFILQGGLGMPDRSYYLDPSAPVAAIRKKYAVHVAAVLKLAGLTDADTRGPRIVALEHQIADVHWSRAKSEDVLKGNNRWRRREFGARAPGLDWEAFFAAAHLPPGQLDFIVWQPSAVAGISALVAKEPLATWKDYLVLHAIEHRAACLPKAVVAEHFAFFEATLNGTPELRPRWKRAYAATTVALGDAVGKLYVERYFSAAAKARIEQMVERLRAAFSRRIDSLEWMAPATKTSAKAKLAALKVGVGYPDHWRDYSALVVVPKDAFGNAERSELFEYRYNLAKLGHPVDRAEWVMTPQTVNAVNLPAMNALNFPAAILQPPLFDPTSDAAQNYGATGATIGHEISHSFDDQGSAFDATGRLHNWWTPADFEHFQAAGARLVAQFDGYRPFPDLAVNGKQALSENIADVAGLAVAFDAYRQSLGGRADSVVHGFTGEQRFFLSYAQSWREKMREPALRRQILANGHAPAEYRGDTVRNLDGWYAAFEVRAGQRLQLAPADRVRVW